MELGWALSHHSKEACHNGVRQDFCVGQAAPAHLAPRFKTVLQPIQGCGLPASKGRHRDNPPPPLEAKGSCKAWNGRSLLPCACTLMPRVSALGASLDRAAAALFAAMQALLFSPCI